MYSIFTGSSDRMVFQVMTNETAFVVSAHPLLGARWDWSREERCVKMITLCNVMPCGLAEWYRYIGPCCLRIVPRWWQEVSLATLKPLCQTAQRHIPEGCDLHETVRSHKVQEVHLHCARP
jgi:hypothetical protein